MEARERLASIIDPKVLHGCADFSEFNEMFAKIAFRKAGEILKALNLTDDAALALMDGEGVAVPKEATPEMIAAGAGCIGARGVPWEAQQADCYRTHLSHSPYEDRDDR
ncbi:hypothetical protein CHELA1G11_11172 [Hyphomicrobiales bacterium]|nr:hypothetical protein CHELA1G11_11172 [Hyphomicrobiales bacterium]CAH1669624.1 conserved hypothetical protein [Hyphomicrobiales bacterium]